jgi:hypothetical protein
MSHDRDAVDYGGSSRGDAESDSDQVPSRLPARAELCIFKLAHDLSSASFMQVSDAHVCLRDGKEAAEQLPVLLVGRCILSEEAKNVALDIRTKLGDVHSE